MADDVIASGQTIAAINQMCSWSRNAFKSDWNKKMIHLCLEGKTHQLTLLVALEPLLQFCKQQLVMSLTISQCVVGWFSVHYSESKEIAYRGKGLEFLDAWFLTIAVFVLCFDCPVILVVHAQTTIQPRLTCGASWVISSADKTLRKVPRVMAETVHRCFQLEWVLRSKKYSTWD